MVETGQSRTIPRTQAGGVGNAVSALVSIERIAAANKSPEGAFPPLSYPSTDLIYGRS